MDRFSEFIQVFAGEDLLSPPPLNEEDGMDVRDFRMVVVFRTNKLNFPLSLQSFLKPADTIPGKFPEIQSLPIRLTQTPARASGCLWEIRGTWSTNETGPTRYDRHGYPSEKRFGIPEVPSRIPATFPG
jgi:hypothetical protein